MAVALGMLQTQPSVLQYCIIAPQEEAAAAPDAAQAEQQPETQQESAPSQSALSGLISSWNARVEEDLAEVLESASIAARDYGFAFSGAGGSGHRHADGGGGKTGFPSIRAILSRGG